MTISGQSPPTFRAFGFTVCSEIDLPELPLTPASGSPDVVVRTGTVPATLEHATVKSGWFQVEDHRFLLDVPGVARYLVAEGTSVTVDASAEGDPDSVRLFLLGSVFGALLHQRGLAPIHGSAIETPAGAVVFAGRSGSGKSALAAAFHARGYPVITDEICAVSSVFGAFCVRPAFPRVLLWPKIVEQLTLQGPNIHAARPNLRKLHVPLDHGFATVPCRIHHIYLLTTTNTRSFTLTPVEGFDRVRKLLRVTFRRSFLSGSLAKAAHFDRTMALARDVGMTQIARPAAGPFLETADLLERDFNP